MSDLISRSALIEVLEKYRFGAISNDAEREYVKETVLNFVKEQPAAYDVDAVAGEIEDVLWNCYIDNGQGFKTYVNRACEILKRGGVE